MPEGRRVLLTDGEERSVLAAVRCLAAHGWSPTVAAHERPAAAHWSRACGARLQVPDPRRDAAAFVARLAEAAAATPHAALVPGSDAALLAISERRELLERHVRLGLPAHERVLACLDKQSLAGAAAEAGMPAPVARVCRGAAEAVAAAGELGYPVVVKPRRPVFEHGGELRGQGGRRADDEPTVRALAGGAGDQCIVQRLERGAVHSCSGVMAGGRLRAVALSRYLRTWPVRGGNAAAAITLDAGAAPAAAVERLLRCLGWEGMFELELIRRADGAYVPIDLNPRPFGSGALVSAAGAPLAAIWCEWLTGGDPDWAQARGGVRYRWEDADARHALWQLRNGRPRAAAAVLRPHRGTVHAYARASDPAPLLARVIYLLRRLRASR